jgi:hypothetical protein
VILTFRPIDQWPDGWRNGKVRKPNPFRSGYRSTLELLDSELDHLKARDAFLQVDADPGDVRLDGQLRANARVGHPGCILTIDTKAHGVLVYPCDTFEGRWSQDPPDWQINLRAIAQGLEALRKVERYGIADRGQQYAGFGALPPATAMGPAMTVEQAAALLASHSPGCAGDIVGDSEVASRAHRAAARQTHPDTGGDPAAFREVQAAKAVLDRHHGVS